MEGKYFMGIRDGGETEVAGGAGKQIEVFDLFFLCRKDLEHGSGGGGGEDCGGRTAVNVVENGGEREVGECGEDRETRLSINTVLCEILRLLLSEAFLFHGEALRLLYGKALAGPREAVWLLHGEVLRLLHGEALQLQNGTTALLLTGAVAL